jgi:hypothetical protein
MNKIKSIDIYYQSFPFKVHLISIKESDFSRKIFLSVDALRRFILCFDIIDVEKRKKKKKKLMGVF